MTISHSDAHEAEIARLKRREQELLETTNRYLQRARDAESLAREAVKLCGEFALRLMRSSATPQPISAPDEVACPTCDGSGRVTVFNDANRPGGGENQD